MVLHRHMSMFCCSRSPGALFWLKKCGQAVDQMNSSNARQSGIMALACKNQQIGLVQAPDCGQGCMECTHLDATPMWVDTARVWTGTALLLVLEGLCACTHSSVACCMFAVACCERLQTWRVTGV